MTFVGQELSDGQLRAIVQAFGRAADRVDVISSGRVNQHWLITAGEERLVLRQYTALRADAAIAYEHAALRRASDRGWPVALPLAHGAKGARVIRYENTRFSLFAMLPGQPLGQAGLANRAITGRLLGRFTSDMAGSWVEEQREGFGRLWELDLFVRPSGFESFNGLVAEFAREHGELARVVRAQRYRNLKELARQGYGDLPATFIHGDFQRENLLFAEGELTGLLDFDSCRMDAAVLDLAASLWLDCLEAPAHDGINVPAARALVEGYARTQMFSERDVRMLPALIRGHFLWFVAFRLMQWRSGDEKALASIKRTAERRFPALDAVSSQLVEALLPLAR